MGIVMLLAALAVVLAPYGGLVWLWSKHRTVMKRHEALKRTYERASAELNLLKAPQRHELMASVAKRAEPSVPTV